MSMYKSKPEFRRMPQVQQYYDISDTIGVASRKKVFRRHEIKNRRGGEQRQKY